MKEETFLLHQIFLRTHKTSHTIDAVVNFYRMSPENAKRHLMHDMSTGMLMKHQEKELYLVSFEGLRTLYHIHLVMTPSKKL